MIHRHSGANYAEILDRHWYVLLTLRYEL